MKKLEIKDYIIYGVLFLIVIAFIISFGVTHKKKVDDNKTSNDSYIILNNASRFFTMEGCVNKYITALSNKDINSLLKLLDNDYIKDNKITNENVLNIIKPLDGIYNFKAKKIYYEKINSKYTKYYIYGLIQKDALDTYDLGTDYYVVLIVDNNKDIFHVVPYDGELFKESA